jgi:septal ring factor EnvC (AmiA/AmiB activator)
MGKTEARKFWASMLMLVIVCGLLCYLTFVPVPEENRDTVLTILGVLLGGASSAMPNLFGSKDGETEKLKLEVAELRAENSKLQAMFNTLKAEHDRITSELVERFAVRKRVKKVIE